MSNPGRTASRNSVRLHGSGREQRIGLRRPEREHAFYNVTLAIVMLLGRFMMAIPRSQSRLVAAKNPPRQRREFPTDGIPFVFLLIGVIVIVGALTFSARSASDDRRATADDGGKCSRLVFQT